MNPAKPPVFVERRTYRLRRLRDAARLLPIIGVLLFLVPLLWTPNAEHPPATARGFVYLFPAWAVLIVAAGWLSRVLSEAEASGSEVEPPQ